MTAKHAYKRKPPLKEIKKPAIKTKKIKQVKKRSAPLTKFLRTTWQIPPSYAIAELIIYIAGLFDLDLGQDNATTIAFLIMPLVAAAHKGLELWIARKSRR